MPAPKPLARFLAIVLPLAPFAPALLLSGCSLGHTMKTVETAPKGEVRKTAGLAVSLPRVPGVAEIPVVGFLWNARHGITDRAELGYSVDGFYPGVGGKYRLLTWLAVDANAKIKISDLGESSPGGVLFDAAMIVGNPRHSGGLKLLSHGITPFMPVWRNADHPDALLFYGYRFGAFMPEVFFAARNRGAGFGVGYLF